MATSQYSYAGETAAVRVSGLARDSGPGSDLVRASGLPSHGAAEVDDIESDYIDAFLDLRPVWSRPNFPGEDPSPGHWGFAAEEVAQIDPRLVHYTYPDEAYEEVEVDGGKGLERRLKPDARRTRPESVAYDRMAVLLQAVAKRQQGELETLEEELCALAARVEALEDAR